MFAARSTSVRAISDSSSGEVHGTLAWHQSGQLAVGLVPCMELLLDSAWYAGRLEVSSRPQTVPEDVDERHEVWFVQERLHSLAQLPVMTMSSKAVVSRRV